MRPGWPSLTAAAVAMGRGIGVRGLGRDDWARRLLPRPLSGVVAIAQRTPTLARLASGGGVDHMALRTAALDASLRAHPTAQVVLLGAGLDARAMRLPCLHDRVVFEVDHPDTQRAKQSRLPLTAVRFVGVDFARDDLGDALAAAGHDPARSSFFLWEGVTMYLPPAAIRATVDGLARRAAPGSVLAFTYIVPALRPGLPRPLGRVVHLGFRALGEPLYGMMTPEQARDVVSEAGFEVLRDSSNRDWARDLGRAAWPATPFRGERMLEARRP